MYRRPLLDQAFEIALVCLCNASGIVNSEARTAIFRVDEYKLICALSGDISHFVSERTGATDVDGLILNVNAKSEQHGARNILKADSPSLLSGEPVFNLRFNISSNFWRYDRDVGRRFLVPNNLQIGGAGVDYELLKATLSLIFGPPSTLLFDSSTQVRQQEWRLGYGVVRADFRLESLSKLLRLYGHMGILSH